METVRFSHVDMRILKGFYPLSRGPGDRVPWLHEVGAHGGEHIHQDAGLQADGSVGDT